MFDHTLKCLLKKDVWDDLPHCETDSSLGKRQVFVLWLHTSSGTLPPLWSAEAVHGIHVIITQYLLSRPGATRCETGGGNVTTTSDPSEQTELESQWETDSIRNIGKYRSRMARGRVSGAKGKTRRSAVAVPNQHIFLLTVGSEKAAAQTLSGLRSQIRLRKVICKRSITNPALRIFIMEN